jgi:AcrR family transcriptional regulator
MDIDASGQPRAPLNRERVLHAAITIADRAGIEALSMRKLGQELGVEAMSLYNHVANKDDLLDGMLDVLVSEIEPPASGDDWKAALRERALEARALLGRHPWAPRITVSRPQIQMGPAIVRYMDAIAGCLVQAGFSWELVHHAMHLLSTRMLGYTQEPLDAGDRVPRMLTIPRRQIPTSEYPYLTQMLRKTHHDEEVEFAFELDLILDSLERLRKTE